MIETTPDMLQTLSDYCAHIGKDKLWVQGAGGNISWKDKTTLWVKASGTWLAHANQKNIFVAVDYQHLHKALTEENFDIKPQNIKPQNIKHQALTTETLKPSIETLLHGLMKHSIVLHLHAVESLAYLIRPTKIWQNFLKTHGDSSTEWIAVPYAKPGEKLAKAIANQLKHNKNANVIFMQNHGIVIGGETIDDIDNMLKKIHQILQTKPYTPKTPQTIPAGFHPDYAPITPIELQAFAYDETLFHHLNHHWAICPDHVVFLGAEPKIYQENSLPESTEDDLIFIKNKGVFVTKNFSTSKKMQLQCYYDLLVRQKNHETLQILSQDDIAELLNWDAEHYRMQLAENR